MKMKIALAGLTLLLGAIYVAQRTAGPQPKFNTIPNRTENLTQAVNIPTKQSAANNSPVSLTVSEPTQTEKLEAFKKIQIKVFKSESEQKQLGEILHQKAFIRELSRYLVNPVHAAQPDFKLNQNRAVDLLMEALKSGDVESARQAMIDVVQDAQLENENLQRPVRESLAGVKAEILYQGSAFDPALAPQFEKVLPGPVSQKIWKNVLQQQAENSADSEAEMRQRLSQKAARL